MLLVSLLMYVIFSYHPWIAASEDWSLTTFFSTKMKGKERQSQQDQYPCPILIEIRHSSPPLCKNH